MMKFSRTLFLIAIAALTTVIAANHPVIEWLRSRDGGHFTEKVFFRDGGMFAAEDISEGEIVMMIPPNALFGPNADDDSDECGTARRLAHEYVHLKEKSDHWPYLQYVFESFPHKSVPIGWSSAGKKIVRDLIVGSELEPRGFGRGSYKNACGATDDDSLAVWLEAAWRIVLSRGWHHIMVPVFDMVNHRNGRYHNVDRRSTTDELLQVDGDYTIVATKDIKAGSQLHNSYNQCQADATCFGIDKSYVTPQIFLDYGFVEQLPRRFAFFYPGDEEEEEDDDEFEYDDEEEDDSSGIVVWEVNEDKKIVWIGAAPNSSQISWLQVHLKRLQDVKNAVTERKRRLKNQYEAQGIMDYYQALTEALQLAINSAPVSIQRDEEEL
mmetsp:Transcript_7170/g.10467  ORF Transcript_7170/g.10467 Transcript_7170/m.10467 type:complete len:381 (+) Transcript_7170:52-1194(+)